MKRPPSNPGIRRVPRRLSALVPTTEQAERLESLAEYVGSSEHKSAPWYGVPAAGRQHANLCPPHLTKAQATSMLQAGIRAGNISEDFDGDMPRRIWYRGPLGIFEARLTERADPATNKPAKYKGWPEVEANLPLKPRPTGPCDEI